MALSFGISPTQNCGKITFKNCSTYCTPTNYDVEYLIARITGTPFMACTNIILQAAYEVSSVDKTVDDDDIVWSGSFAGSPVSGPVVAIPAGDSSIAPQTITLTITDSDGLVSTTQIIFETSASGSCLEFEYLSSPGLSVTSQFPNPDLIVGFGDNSYFDTSTLDDTTIEFLPESPGAPTLTSMPQNHDYGVVGTYSAVYTFDDSEGNTLSTTVPIIITADETDCTSELTETGLDSIVLYITDPDNVTYTHDITDDFFDAPFTLNSEDIADLESETWASGIWTFRLIVTKDNGVQLVSEIKVTLICAEECAFQAALINYAQEEATCCDECKNEKEENLIIIRTYIQAIKNANACGSQTQITKFLSLIQRKLANENCGCGGYN